MEGRRPGSNPRSPRKTTGQQRGEEWLKAQGFFESPEYKQDVELMKHERQTNDQIFTKRSAGAPQTRHDPTRPPTKPNTFTKRSNAPDHDPTRPPSKPSTRRRTPGQADGGPDDGDTEARDAPAKFPHLDPDDPQAAQLTFDCDFESGNVGEVQQVDEYEYEIKIRPDTNSPRHRVWFYFRVRGCRKNQRVVFHISNYSKTKTLFREGFTPVVRSTSRWQWSRLPPSQVFYYRCPRHKKKYCFAFTFMFDREDDEYYFAYSFPYTYTYLQKWLHSIEYLKLPYFRRDLLCRTVLQRRLDLLTITSPNLRRSAGGKRPPKSAVVITSRIHPGETPASYVCHGIVEFLISDHPVAKQLRDLSIFYIVPMLNPDGVFLGNYRCNSVGLDGNRHWRNPNWRSHPTITAAKMLLRQLAAMDGVDLEYFIDIHAHTTAMNGFVYCNSVEGDKEKNDLQTVFPRLLDVYCSDFSFDKSKFCTNPKKAGSGRRAMGDLLTEHSVCCYTLEVSFYCSSHGGLKGEPYTQETYKKIGHAIVKAMGDIFQVPREERASLKGYTKLTRFTAMRADRGEVQQSTNEQKLAVKSSGSDEQMLVGTGSDTGEDREKPDKKRQK